MSHAFFPSLLAAGLLSLGPVMAYADQAPATDTTPNYYLGNSGLAGAEGHAAQAKAQYDQAYANLKQTVADARLAFGSSSDFQSAQQELTAAQTDYDKAADNIRANLATDSAYKELTDGRDAIETQLHGPALSADARLDLATRKLRISTAITNMETKAWSDNADALAAKNRLAAAKLSMKQLVDRFEASLGTDPKVVAAKTALDKASVEKAEAFAYLNGVVADKQAAIAEANSGYGAVTQYSYPYGTGNPNAYGGYPYGYDYGYPNPYFYGYGYGYGGFSTIIINQHNHDHDHGQNPNGNGQQQTPQVTGIGGGNLTGIGNMK